VKAALVLTTVSDVKTARQLAHFLVKERLAACVSFRTGFVSVFRWKGKIQTARETLLLIKIPRRNYSKVVKALKARHPYELPEIILLPLERGSQEYLTWLSASTV